MKVYLGSKNIVKINATKEVLEKYGFEVIGKDVDSKVSAQPKCDKETLTGAYNRAKALPKGSFRIGLEAGVELLEEDLYLAEIVNVNVSESILVDGKISMDKFVPICYEPSGHGYYKMQGKVGNAFSDGKKLK